MHVMDGTLHLHITHEDLAQSESVAKKRAPALFESTIFCLHNLRHRDPEVGQGIIPSNLLNKIKMHLVPHENCILYARHRGQARTRSGREGE